MVSKRVRLKPIVLVTLGLIWLTTVVWLFAGNVILRETRLGFVAKLLDKLPPVVSNLIFIFVWAVILLGWAIPIASGIREIARSSK